MTPHADLCKDPQFQELFGRQVDCTSGNLSAILVPCEEGYVLDQSIEGASNGMGGINGLRNVHSVRGFHRKKKQFKVFHTPS